MLTILVGALAALQAQAAPTLWENVTAGMSVTELRALYPASGHVRHGPERTTIRGHQISPECRADVHVVHRGDSVGGIVMRGEPAIAARCGTAIYEMLAARHGPPLSEATGRPSRLQRIRTTSIWRLGAVHLRYVRFDTEGWGGAGLGNASWEMSLSASPDPVRL